MKTLFDMLFDDFSSFVFSVAILMTVFVVVIIIAEFMRTTYIIFE